MPDHPPRPLTIRDLAAAKQARRPLSMVTAYDWPTVTDQVLEVYDLVLGSGLRAR